MSRSLVSCTIALALGLGAACAGQRGTLRSENTDLREELAELKAQRRRDRRALRDLERKLVVEDGERPRDLPVAVVGPEPVRVGAQGESPAVAPAEGVADAPVAELAEPGAELAYADDEVEIVYVGEAAKDETVRPSIKLYETRDRPAVPVAAHTPITRTRATDRLSVTRGKVPPLPRERVAEPERAAEPDPRALYKQHYQALRDGQHAAAIEGFRAFLRAYPAHDYADNAQYWLGEAYYDQRDYARARTEFEKVAKSYPDGNKVSDAMLKTAFCHEQLGEPERARALLAEVIERFPKTNAAALAADRLVKLQAKD